MRRKIFTVGLGALTAAAVLWGSFSPAQAQQAQKPNILFIMGDDIGWFNVGAYHQGIMSGKTIITPRRAARRVVRTS